PGLAFRCHCHGSLPGTLVSPDRSLQIPAARGGVLLPASSRPRRSRQSAGPDEIEVRHRAAFRRGLCETDASTNACFTPTLLSEGSEPPHRSAAPNSAPGPPTASGPFSSTCRTLLRAPWLFASTRLAAIRDPPGGGEPGRATLAGAERSRARSVGSAARSRSHESAPVRRS